MSLSNTDIIQNMHTVYQRLLSYINNPYGVSAAMGNIWTESAGTFDPRIVQGYRADTFDGCITYTNNVDNGTISEYNFVNNGPNGGGYGLVQWTYYTRKQGLYDRHISDNVSIGDMNLQIEYLMYELENGYSDVLTSLENASALTMYDATVKFMVSFENPLDQSASAKNKRYQNAISVFNECSGLPPIGPDVPGGSIPVWMMKHYLNRFN